MTKRIISVLLIIMMVFALVACGSDNNASDTTATNQQGSQSGSSNNNDETKDTDESSVNADMANVLEFMSYNIYYPTDAMKNPSDYGNLVGDSNYIIVVEAPSIAGIIHEVDDIADAPEVCEEYITHTLESKMRSKFDNGNTTQNITKTTKKTYNGIDMLLVEGTFVNDLDGTTYEYYAIYLLAGDNGNHPVYLVGIPMVDGYDVASIVEEVAKNIKKQY